MGWRDRAIKVEDVSATAAPAKSGSWRDRAIQAEAPRPEDANSTSDDLKRLANWYARTAALPLGPLALAVPQFDVAPLKGGTELESAAKGLEQGASLGFEDENAGVRAGAKALVSGEDPLDAYRKTRDADRHSVKASKDANGKSFFAGELLGSALVPTPVGKGSFAKAAISGAKTGAGYGAGTSEADLTKGELGKLLLDMGVGGAAGAAGGALGEGLGRGFNMAKNAFNGSAIQKFIEGNISKPVVKGLKGFAAKQALRASGYGAHDVKPIARRDLDLPIERGMELLREGNIKPFSNVEGVAQRAEASVERYGDAIGKTLEAADSIGMPFDIRRFVDRARKEILDPIKGDPIMEPEAAKLASLLNKYEQLADVGFGAANKMKGNVQKKINWGNFWNDAKADVPNEVKMQLQGVMLDEVDNQLGEAFSTLGQPGQRIRDAFKEIKRRFGIHSDSLDKAKKAAGNNMGKDVLSIKDLMVGSGLSSAGAGAALMAGNPGMALGAMALSTAGAFGNKVLRERGASAAAAGANQIASALERKWSIALPDIITKAPQLLGRYGPVLAREFKQRGLQGLLAVDRALTQEDPEYRKAKEQELARRAAQ